MKRFSLLFFLFLFSVFLVFSADFGLLAENRFDWENDTLTYSPGLTPWVSWNKNQNFSAYLSAGLSMKYTMTDNENNGNDGFTKPLLLFELYRFSFTFFGQNSSLEGGRLLYTDTLGMTASGLFDGARIRKSFSRGALHAGLLYSGFQYRETAKITMTGSDFFEFSKPYETPENYFASRRLLAFGRWDMPFLEFHNFTFEALLQFDCNGSEEILHSQYFALQTEFFANRMSFAIGAVAETMENGEDDFFLAFGARMALRMEVPGSLNDSLKLTSKFSSGPWNETLAVFTPVTSVPQGQIFSGAISGVWVNRLNYDVKIANSLFMESSFSYFIRTFTPPEESGFLYGGELNASLSWQPLEDIRFYAGGGIFFPELGDIYPSGAEPMWKVHAGFYLSF